MGQNEGQNRRPWVCLWADVLDSRKLAKAGEAADWLYTRLLALCGERGNGDTILDASAEDIAWRLRRDEADIEQRLRALADAGLIEREGSTIRIVGWGDRQPARTDAERARESREKKARPNGDRSATERRPNGDRSGCDDPTALEPDAYAEAYAEAEEELSTHASACKPRARDQATAPAPGPDGVGKGSGSGQSRPAKTGAGDRALRWVIDNRASPEAKINDALENDEALKLAVRYCGGWPKLVGVLGDDDPVPLKAQTVFTRAFGKACAELRGPRRGGDIAAQSRPGAK